MSVNRWIFLVVVLGGLTLFIAQNLSVIPPLPLVFLGVQTQALPLSIWILISIIAGVIAYEFIASLLKLPNLRQPQDTFKSFSNRRSRQTKTSTYGYSQRYSTEAESRSEDNTSPPRGTTRNQTRQYDNYDSWENAGEVDDWDFEDEREKASDYYRDTKVRDTDTSRNNQTTQSSDEFDSDSDSDSDFDYSYNSREAKNPGVGRVESIYDADYRVITSPYKSSSAEQFDEAKNQEDDYDDEWDFLEDDDFEVKDKRPQK